METSVEMLSNRVYRRILLFDYRKPISSTSSQVALLAAMEGRIKGHEPLPKASFLYMDISINSLVIRRRRQDLLDQS
jgi:hypothetical protein